MKRVFVIVVTLALLVPGVAYAQVRPIERGDFGPQATQINFDDLPSETFVGNLYESQGVLFDNAVARQHPFAVSPPNFITTPYYDSPPPLTMRFPRGAIRVGIQIDSDGYSAARQPQMRVFDIHGNLIGVQNFGQGPDFAGFESLGNSIYVVQVGSVLTGIPGSFVATDGYDNLIFETGGLTEIKITSARMVSDHELQVMTKRDFGNQIGHVSLTMIISGILIATPVQDLGTNVNDVIDQQPFVVDLRTWNVPRFTTNQRFFITAHANFDDGNHVDDTKATIILLPVVIVPGIQPDPRHPELFFGGDGTYRILEQDLKHASEIMLEFFGPLGEGYRLRRDQTGYPTLYTLNYDTNNASFSEGAFLLRGLIFEDVKRRTYADAVNLVTQSKGGLVARQFVVNYPDSPQIVKQLIMCAPPNLGSVWARFNAGIFDYGNLYALWPWFRAIPRQEFRPSRNPHLNRLNEKLLPNMIPYTIIYSQSLPTTMTYTVRGHDFTESNGDGVVPAFSARGLMIDPNNLLIPPARIPAFSTQGILLDEVSIPGWHVGYNELPEVMNAIFARLIKDIVTGE